MDNSLEDLLADETFVLWLRGEGTAKQKKYWDNWLQEDPERRLIVREAKEIVSAFDNEYEVPDPHKELEKLDRAIDQYESHQQLNRLISTFSYKKQSYRMVGRRAAAVALIIIMLGGIVGYYYTTDQRFSEQEVVSTPKVEEYHTDYGEKLTFRLSDGSRITLNGNSSLSFSSTVEDGLNTEVSLEGEAYFNIAHLDDNKERTFTVRTDDGIVSVLGTRFVVNTFRNETKTVLEEGKITIENTGSSASYELAPGELASFKSEDNKIAIREVYTRVYTSWTEDKLTFENTSMEDVANRIEDTFGVEVVLSSKYANETLSGSIKSNNLNVLRKALEEVLRTEIEQKEGKLFIGIN